MMKINFRTFTSILLFSTLISIIVGIIFYGLRIFDIKSPLFQFISFGFIGAITFSLLKLEKFILVALINIVLFIGLYYMTGHHYLVAHLFYYISLLITIFIYSVLIFDHLMTAAYLRPLILAAMLSIFFVSDTFLLSAIYSRSINSTLVFKNMIVGLLIGLSTGLGIELVHILIRKESNS